MSPQSVIAHYRLASKLGEGGMGTVWRATDTRLNREVAVKILPDDFAADPDRLARFAREAQVLASLNHPNIAAIYGVEDRALILELVEGPTLAERIARGPIPLDEALPLLQQLSAALEYAHEKGVVHRDLKPANLKITPDGRLKVLDFGLAKALTPDAAAPDPKSSPTLTMRATMAGAIMGTAAYMAPEQARGHAVDKRADIWAFGVVAWEMLAGRVLFDAPTVSDTLALVLTRDPDLAAVPEPVRPLLARCLDRDHRKRLRDIGDALPLIAKAPDAAPGQRTRAPLALGAVAAAGILVASALSFVHFREAPPAAAPPMRFEIPAPPGAAIGAALALSPDGRRIAFSAQAADRPRQLWIRELDSLESRALPGSEDLAASIFWSADSRFLYFSNGGQIRSAEFPARSVDVVCAGCPNILGGGSGSEGLVLFSNSFNGLAVASAAGAAPTPLTGGASVRGSVWFLRDGRRFFYARPGRGIYLGSLDAPLQENDSPFVPSAESRFVYVQSPVGPDYLVFERAGTLLSQRLDRDRLTPVGAPATLANEVVSFTASNTGVLAYRAGIAASLGSRLVWYDRSGKQVGQLGTAANNSGISSISADGKAVYLERAEPNGSTHVWSGDVTRGVFSRVGVPEGSESAPHVLPDGRLVIMYAPRGGVTDLYVIGAGQPELWVKSPNMKHPNDISPDGRFLIYDDHNGQSRQDLLVFKIPAPGDPPSQPVPFVVSRADETFGQFSPDGRWVAYSSDETGRREVYVREFLPNANPAAGARKWLVSIDGGDKPRWAHNGKELYFVSLNGKMMAAPVKTAPTFDPGIPIPLFDIRYTGFSPYVVAPNGRFLINTPGQSSNEPSAPITVVLNWPATLK